MTTEISISADREFRLAHLRIFDPKSGREINQVMSPDELLAMQAELARAQGQIKSGAKLAHVDLKRIFDH